MKLRCRWFGHSEFTIIGCDGTVAKCCRRCLETLEVILPASKPISPDDSRFLREMQKHAKTGGTHGK